jgi:hypothetical protein
MGPFDKERKQKKRNNKILVYKIFILGLFSHTGRPIGPGSPFSPRSPCIVNENKRNGRKF